MTGADTSHACAEQANLTCPACEHAFGVAVWLLLDLSAQPDLWPRLQAGDLHAFACPACGQTIELDAPLLVYRPDAAPPLLFSPAQGTSQEQDQEQAAGLIGLLQERLGDAWEDAWLAEMPVVPRPLLPALLNDDPEAALRDLAVQAQEALGLPEPVRAQALADNLIAWIQQETLDDAEAYLHQHKTDLLTDEAAAVMQMLAQSNPQNPAVADHQQRLMQARALGIAAMYAAIRQQRLMDKIQQAGPIGRAVAQFIQVDDDDTAVSLLQAQPDLLLTWDAGELLRQLAAATPENNRLQNRYQQWQTARLGSRPDTAVTQAQTQLLETQGQSGPRYEIGAAMFTAVGDNAVTLNVLNFGAVSLRWRRLQMLRPDLTQIAIGRRDELDTLHRQLHGQDVAIVGKGRADRRSGAVRGMPGVGKSTLAALYAEAVIGQRDQAAEAALLSSPVLPELHRLLAAHFNLEELKTLCFNLNVDYDNLSGAGKESKARELVLYLDQRSRIGELRDEAAQQRPRIGWPEMPAPDRSPAEPAVAGARYPDDLYPGGVLWLQLGPSYTTPESVLPALSRLAALVYSNDEERLRLDLPLATTPQTLEQIQNSLQSAIFTPDAIQRLLSGHGRFLIIVDDVWERQILPTIRQALPPEAHLLVTTRDDRVAQAVGHSLPLDVLSQEDALTLIRQKLPPMPLPTAERLIQVAGAHPMALQIALGDLNPADPPAEWAEAVEKIAYKLAQGLGVDPTTLDDIEPEKRFSGLMALSYQALAAHGQLQRCFRTLGSLAAAAPFATRVAAAICSLAETEIRDALKILRDRNLLRRLDDARWQQHTLLHSYALEQQTPAERLAWGERHAAYFLEAMRAADDSQTYYTLAPDLPNLRHAFAWAVGAGRALGLAQALLSNCANLLQSQNLGREYLAWAGQVQALAQKIGSPQDQGAALLSLGNALQNAATVVDGPDRAARLKEALAAYDEALEKRRDVPLDYATTQNNRANLLSDLATLPGEDRAARLKEALAAYDEALEKRRDVPLDYATTQNNRAVLLSDLATLPGEDRAARLKEALAAYDEALEKRRDVPLDYAQTQNNRAVLLSDLATLPGEDRAARLKEALADVASALQIFEQVQQAQYLAVGRRTLAGLIIALGPAEFRTAWGALTDQPIPHLPFDLLLSSLVQQAGINSQEALLARLQDDPAFKQRLDELMTFAGESPAAPRPDLAAQDPASLALAALLQVDSAAALQTALAQHPALRELPTLAQLAALAAGAQQAGQPEAAHHLLARLLILLEQYNAAHTEQIDAAEQGQFVELLEASLPLAEESGEDLAVSLRRLLGWALNTLGNHYATQADHAAAAARYTQAIAHAPENAMLYRNRAGEYLEMGEVDLAAADVARAAALEPDAPRLVELRRALAGNTDRQD